MALFRSSILLESVHIGCSQLNIDHNPHTQTYMCMHMTTSNRLGAYMSFPYIIYLGISLIYDVISVVVVGLKCIHSKYSLVPRPLPCILCVH